MPWIRVFLPGEGGAARAQSSESSDEEYTCKEESAVAPLFLTNNRSDRALVLYCVFPAFLNFKNAK